MTRLSPLKIPILILGFSLGWTISDFVPASTSFILPAKSAIAQASQESATQQMTAANNQSAEQQQKDISECYSIAKARTGIDPSALGMMAPMAGKAGSAGAGASKDAKAPADALSEAAQAVSSGASVQTTPAAPATPATGQGAAASADKAQKLDTFKMANQACLQARGYVVKQPSVPAAATPAPPKQ